LHAGVAVFLRGLGLQMGIAPCFDDGDRRGFAQRRGF
jgi:hypothetical protein